MGSKDRIVELMEQGSYKEYTVPCFPDRVLVGVPLDTEELFIKLVNGIYSDDRGWVAKFPPDDLKKIVTLIHSHLITLYGFDFDWVDGGGSFVAQEH